MTNLLCDSLPFQTDLVFNNIQNYTPELGEKVRKASRSVAALMDPDQDDDVPLETLATFCRLTRMRLLKETQIEMQACRFALIVCDVQNDFVTGPVCVQDWHSVNLLAKIPELRAVVDTVVFSKDWHPENHCSFAASTSTHRSAMRRGTAFSRPGASAFVVEGYDLLFF